MRAIQSIPNCMAASSRQCQYSTSSSMSAQMLRATSAPASPDWGRQSRCDLGPIALWTFCGGCSLGPSRANLEGCELRAPTIEDHRGPSMDARALIAEVIRKSPVTSPDNTLLSDIDGWDSLKGVRLVLRLEEIVGRQLSEDDIEGLQSVADVERLLKSGD